MEESREPQAAGAQVVLQWRCQAADYGGGILMERVAEGRPLWQADVSAGLECPSSGNETIVTLQVTSILLRRATRCMLPTG